MEHNDDNLDIINKEDTDEIVEREQANTSLTKVAVVFMAFCLAFSLHSLVSIIEFATDNSVPLVNCPKTFDLDAPVLMKTLSAEDAKAKDRWIRGFIRRFVLSQFPRTMEDVAPFFEYAKNHSKGFVKDKYESLLVDAEEVKNIIRAGSFFRFYPKHGDSSQMRIRATDDPNFFIVEVDGYLIKKMGQIQERYTPTLRYKVELGKSTLDNPEGLYVVEANIEQITDYVSGTKENL